MKKLFGLFVFVCVLCLGVPAYSCVSAISSTAQWIDLNPGGRVVRVLHADLRQGSDKLRADDMKERLQNIIDVRIPLADLPDDEPTKHEDPARPDFFWDKGDLVARPCIVTDVFWDGERFVATITRAR